MGRLSGYGFFAVLAVALVCSCEGRVIPGRKLASIYADMFIADQWIRNDNSLSRAADTSLVYEPIFRKYGYTSKDYNRSLEHYMRDPEKFAKIFEQSQALLQGHLDEMNRIDREKQRLDSAVRVRMGRPFKRPVLYEGHRAFASPFTQDTLAVSMDSSGIFVLERVVLDTMFTGPVLIVRKLRQPADSLAADKDSLSRRPIRRAEITRNTH